MHRSRVRSLSLVLASSALSIGVAARTADSAPSPAGSKAGEEKVIFFAADCMRQDLAESYVSQGWMPAVARLLLSGAKAADGGLLTQAPANTGAGWYSLSTGAWAGVHGSTNNTSAVNGASIVVLSWRLLNPTAKATLSVRPFLSGRDYHAMHHENSAFQFHRISPMARLCPGSR